MGFCRYDSVCGAFLTLAPPRLPTLTTVRGAGRSRISIAISLVIVIVAAAVLYHLLRDIDIGKVVTALQAQSAWRVVIAGMLVVAGYSNLVCYDLFALHTIGKRNVPLRVVAFASFTSYTIGHSLGAATLTCGLVRLRVYSFWQMNFVHIAKIALFTGMTYWLGNIVVLAGRRGLRAASIEHGRSPAGLVEPAGRTRCFLCRGWLPRLARGRATHDRPRQLALALPGVRGTLLQIGIGMLDRVLASLCMYVLLPANPDIGFAAVLVVFVTATLLGIVSHTPGSLGVVEAAMLVGLPQYPREELLAALVTFRVLDFFLPLMMAMLMFGARELRLLARQAQNRRRADMSLGL